MADYTATTDMTLEACIAAGPMVDGDALDIEDGAVVTCAQTPSVLMGKVTITKGEYILDGENATNPIIYAYEYGGDTTIRNGGKFNITKGWYDLGTTDGTDSQVISGLGTYFNNTRLMGFSGLWVETGRRIDFDNASGETPEVNDYVNLSSDSDVFGLIEEVGVDYLIVRYLLGSLTNDDAIEVRKVVENSGPQYTIAWTADVNNASGDIKAAGVYQEFANVYTNSTSHINEFGSKSSGFVFEMPFESTSLTLGGSGTGGFVPPSGCNVRVPMVTNSMIELADYTVGNASFGTVATNSRGRLIISDGGIIDISGVNRYYDGWFAFCYDPKDVKISYVSTHATIRVNRPLGSPASIDHIICSPPPVGIVGDATMVVIFNAFTTDNIISNILVVSTLQRQPIGTIFAMTSVNDVAYENIIEVMGALGSQTSGSMTVCKNVSINNFMSHGRYIPFSLGVLANDMTFTNIKRSNSINGNASETSSGYCFNLGAGASGIYISNIENMEGSKYTQRLVNADAAADNIKVRAIGSPSLPLQMNVSSCIRGYFRDFNIARCYFTGAGSSYGVLWQYGSSYKNYNLTATSCGDMEYKMQRTPLSFDSKLRGLYAGSGAPGSSTGLYIGKNDPGLFFLDLFRSSTTGAIVLFPNVATPKNSLVTVVAGNPFFNYGYIDFEIGDIIEYETNYSCLGHIQFTGLFTTCIWDSAAEHADEASNLTFEFQYDTGLGWNGSWLDVRTASNLTGISDFRTGIKLKVRITATATTVNFSGLFLDTTTSLAAQEDNLYPIDQNERTLAFTGLADNTEVRVYKVSDDTELMGTENSSGGTFSGTFIHPGADIEVYYHIINIDYKWIRNASFTLTDADITIPIQQIPDTTYKNP